MSELLLVVWFCFFSMTRGMNSNAEHTIEPPSVESCETLVVRDLPSFRGKVNMHHLSINSKYDTDYANLRY